MKMGKTLYYAQGNEIEVHCTYLPGSAHKHNHSLLLAAEQAFNEGA